MKSTIKACQHLLQGEFLLPSLLEDSQENSILQGASINSQSIQSGMIFFALEGARDGHHFLPDAQKNGAALAIVSKDLTPSMKENLQRSSGNMVVMKVSDVQSALVSIAKHERALWNAKVVAITGSAGKSSVKQWCLCVLSARYRCAGTKGNLNNHLGIPLSVLNLPDDLEAVVLEMGANHEGEISEYVRWIRPDISLIVNAHKAHVGAFGSTAAIVRAKGEILDDYPKDVVLSLDSPHFQTWQARAQHNPSLARILTFSHPQDPSQSQPLTSEAHAWVQSAAMRMDNQNTDANACVGAKIETKIEARLETKLVLRAPNEHQSTTITPMLNALGTHQATNAAAAAAVGLAMDLVPLEIQKGLEDGRMLDGRLSMHTLDHQGHHLQVLDDSYNGSPESFESAFSLLQSFQGAKVLVAGDMRELGEESPDLHEALVASIKKAGIGRIFCIGARFASLAPLLEKSGIEVQSFGASLDEKYDNNQEKKEALKRLESSLRAYRDAVNEPCTFLIKGARYFQLEKMVSVLLAQ